MTDSWENPAPDSVCDICHLGKEDPAERPVDDWNEATGNHLSCEEFMGRGGR